MAGDSGGPLLYPHTVDGEVNGGQPERDVVIGITSCGEPCERPNSHGAFTRLSALRPWVEATIQVRCPLSPAHDRLRSSSLGKRA